MQPKDSYYSVKSRKENSNSHLKSIDYMIRRQSERAIYCTLITLNKNVEQTFSKNFTSYRFQCKNVNKKGIK